MPVVAIPIEDLNRRLNTQLSNEEMELRLEQLGCDIEEFTQIRRIQCNVCNNLRELTLNEEMPNRCTECGHTDDKADFWSDLGNEDVVRMDLLPVRPDIFDPGGLSRALRGLLDLKTGLPDYEIGDAQLSLTVDPIVQEESSYRPYIGCAVIRGLSFDDFSLRLVMKLQENLHWALGRNRKLASIGVYDLSTINGPLKYTAVEREGIRFTPLFVPDQQQTPQEVLETHPKGVAFANLLDGYTHVPMLVDANEQVLSMPPIINSHETRVTIDTKDVFIDVTGITQKAVTKTLHTIVTSMLELFPGAKAERVEVQLPEEKVQTPSLEKEVFRFDVAACSRLIGIPLDDEKAMGLLRQMRHQVGPHKDGEGFLEVTVASYRNDLMHEVDLMEDLAIAYGYQNIVPVLVPTMTVAQERPERVIANRARNTMTGLGFFEVMSLILSNAEEQYDLLNLDDPDEAVLIKHPASVEQTLLRTSLMPQLLKLFALNRGQGLPQRLFEVDDVVRRVEGQELPIEEVHLSAGIIDSEVGFADIKALCEALGHELGMHFTFKVSQHPGMLPGRVAEIHWNEHKLGVMGEIHPSVLEKLRLTHPIVALEIDLTPLCGPLLPTH